jgi:adenosylcobinamide-phosphate synthase
MIDSPLIILFAAVLLDACVGELPAPVHPVVWMGKLISVLLRGAPARGWWRQLAYGTCLALVVIVLSTGLAFGALYLTAPFPLFQGAVGVFLLQSTFALRELGRAAERVVQPLGTGELDRARTALRSLCSRDPSQLGEAELLAGTIESLAENASDSVVAPLFYFVLFGIPGAVAYRAINTLDAMIGYRGSFEALGKFAARLDDVANWLPARLTAALLLLAGWVHRLRVAEAWRIWRRDANKTPSPNGGRPMAVIAGLLAVRLEKPGVYILGDAGEPLTPTTARTAWRLVVWASAFMIALCALALSAAESGWSLPAPLLHQGSADHSW